MTLGTKLAVLTVATTLSACITTVIFLQAVAADSETELMERAKVFTEAYVNVARSAAEYAKVVKKTGLGGRTSRAEEFADTLASEIEELTEEAARLPDSIDWFVNVLDPNFWDKFEEEINGKAEAAAGLKMIGLFSEIDGTSLSENAIKRIFDYADAIDKFAASISKLNNARDRLIEQLAKFTDITTAEENGIYTYRSVETKKTAEQEARLAVETEKAAANALFVAAGRIRASIEANWRRPRPSLRGLKVVIGLRVGRNGEVQSARIVKSSGDSRFDESAELAVQSASPLPIPKEPEYYEYIKEFHVEFNPDE